MLSLHLALAVTGEKHLATAVILKDDRTMGRTIGQHGQADGWALRRPNYIRCCPVARAVMFTTESASVVR